MALNNLKKWMVVLVNLEPTIGVEINKTRPCLIVSPNAANRHLQTVIIAPLTSTIRKIPTRFITNFNQIAGEICLDQLKSIDKKRVIKLLGELPETDRSGVNRLLREMFSEE